MTKRTVTMDRLPICDLCDFALATFDTPVKIEGARIVWAYVCDACYQDWGVKTDVGFRLMKGGD